MNIGGSKCWNDYLECAIPMGSNYGDALARRWEMEFWCEENCKGFWSNGDLFYTNYDDLPMDLIITFRFEMPEEAALFMLFFS